MANHASAKKRHRQNLKKNERNSAVRSRMRKAIKEARAAVDANADDKAAQVQKAVREVYIASSKNVIQPGTASRNVSRLMKLAAAR
ncbi:MAG: 30S ribosomal protein S20 [Deltaproteobacteria bacterium]|jgi:small subunit ribosomal protein S20